MVYWTTSREPKPVYHVYNDCPEGQKIENKDRETGEPPTGYRMCEICEAKLLRLPASQSSLGT